jgi:hypothetical protein
VLVFTVTYRQVEGAYAIEKSMILNLYAVVRFCVLLGVSLFTTTLLLASSPNHVNGLSPSSPRPSSSTAVERRTFMNRLPFAIVGVSTAISTATIHPHAKAYERRDVGGPDASPETKAMNLQAYETNNRLERDGVKLEVINEKRFLLYVVLI